MKKAISIFLIFVMMICAFSACGEKEPVAEETDQSTEPSVSEVQSEKTEEPEEKEELSFVERQYVKEDGSIELFYDDIVSVSELTDSESTSFEIVSQQPTSKQVGSNASDEAVLYYEESSGLLVAVGTGSAVVKLNGEEKTVSVVPAPISLVMITGHSIGEGSQGEAGASVVCKNGQTYSSHKELNFEGDIQNVGIGTFAANKPENINAFAMAGRGTPGEASGLAYRWNQLTGEKIWVLNAAVGGSCLNEWIQGEQMYNDAVSLYRTAAQILANEVAAGHYVFKNSVLINHSCANFVFKNVEFDNEKLEQWHNSMWNGFKTDLAFDINGDGTQIVPEGIGYVPIWTPGQETAQFTFDRPAVYYMSAFDSYPDCFTASMIATKWLTNESVRSNFPEINYETHGISVERPSSTATVYAKDNTHFLQVGYNALGMDVAENLFRYLRTEIKADSIRLLSPSGNEIGDSIVFSRQGVEYSVVIETEPCSLHDLTITTTDNLEIGYPFLIKDVGTGEGTVTISQGDTVLKTITVQIAE